MNKPRKPVKPYTVKPLETERFYLGDFSVYNQNFTLEEFNEKILENAPGAKLEDIVIEFNESYENGLVSEWCVNGIDCYIYKRRSKEEYQEQLEKYYKVEADYQEKLMQWQKDLEAYNIEKAKVDAISEKENLEKQIKKLQAQLNELNN